MRISVSIILLAVWMPSLSAQQSRLPLKEAQGYAKVCVEQIGNPYNGPLNSEVDVSKPCAELGEGGGAMVIPEKTLSKKLLQNVGKQPVVIGQLWLRKWALVADGKVVPREKLNVVTITIEDKNRPMPLLTLAVRSKNKKKKVLELLLFSESKKPLQVIGLAPDNIIQDLPLEIEWKRGEKQHDPLTLRILGRYQTVLHITRAGR